MKAVDIFYKLRGMALLSGYHSAEFLSAEEVPREGEV